ncbi:hypothetical protein Patl1_32228 [Pistacia atlantica]|uniref:Uncharacterized protein n=1 Tax=Pistacia atlantica TaxID=434234 RepID=A0ACC1AQJ6_9ROSI|nr:hypothetical protein Patl1_32228 [Pistacia atlantica]
MQQYYCQGTFDNYSSKWAALLDCLILKTKPSSRVEFMVTCSPSVSVYSNVFLPGWRPSTAKYDEEKIELFTRESNSDAKIAQPEACGVNKVCTCRRCEEKADGKDCLVCDSCEEMYRFSCIEPTVKEIPPKIWYCGSCAAKGIGLPHENCVVCEAE